MNNKKAMTFLISIFFLAVIALLSIGLVNFVNEQPDIDDLTIGATQEQLIQQYGRAADVEQYLSQALKQSVQDTIYVVRESEIDEEIRKQVSAYMTSHPTTPLFVNWQVQANYDDSISIQANTRFADTTTSTTGIFYTWPVQQEPYLTSLFGTRQVESGSTNHPGIDIRAPAGEAVYALTSGQITDIKEYSTTIRHDNGWTCGYLHASPLDSLEVGVLVDEQEQIAVVAQEEGYDPHLDVRCQNHDQPLFVTTAKQQFGEQHFATPYATAPADTVYATAHTGADVAYVDPYCLFSDEIRIVLQQNIDDSLSGFAYRKEANSIQEQLEETCSAYEQAGIISHASQAGIIQALLDQTIENEGEEYTNNPADYGGPTKYGITQDTLRRVRGTSVSATDVQQLTRREAEDIYVQRYLKQPGFDRLPIQIVPIVYDTGILFGPGDAKEMLAEVLQENGYEQATTNIDVLVELSREAIIDRVPLNDLYVDKRIQRHRQRVQEDSTQQVFLAGWIARAEKYRGGWSRSSQLQEQAGLSFETVTSATYQLSSQESQLIQAREELARAIEQTPITQEVQIPDAWSACTEYIEQLPTVIERCAEQMKETGCACQLPAPVRQATLTPTLVSDGVSQERIDWHLQGDEGVRRTWYGIRTNESNVSVTQLQLSQSGITYQPQNEAMKRMELNNSVYYVEFFVEDTNDIFLFSNTTDVAICDYKTPETYCRDDQILRVERRQTE